MGWRKDARGTSAFHVGNGSPSFVSNMRRLLQVKAAKHYTHGHKQGKIAQSRVWRVGMPPIDGGDWNGRVFKRKTSETDLLDTAVSILVDWSGSMDGAKSYAAAQGAGLINQAFGHVLHVPLRITAFTSAGPTPVLGMMKGWNEVVSSDAMAERFSDFLDHMSGNNDADTLMWAYHDILTRKEKRKVIIVLSDGSPADGIGDPFGALKSVASTILNEKRVDLYGLGIMDNNVAYFYPKHKVIKDVSELEPALVELMGKALA
jgi:cobaltochelatase CobT